MCNLCCKIYTRGDFVMALNNNYKIIGDRIHYARKQCGLTLEEMEKRIGVHKGTLSRWETGKTKNIKLPMLEKLASIFHVNATWLAGGDVPMYAQIQNKNNVYYIPILR